MKINRNKLSAVASGLGLCVLGVLTGGHILSLALVALGTGTVGAVIVRM